MTRDWEGAMHTRERAQRFAQLAPHEKIEVRIAWLERKVVGLLWGMIGLASMAVGFGAAYFVGELMETRSMWVLTPVGIIAWLVSGWVFQKREFRGAPPHIDYIDP
jgi:hypothetical protein